MDAVISEWILENTHGNDFINRLMFFITKFGVGYIFWLIFILALLLFNLIKKKKISINILLMLIFLLLAHIIGECILKNIVKRFRPYHTYNGFVVFMNYYKYSLPSGYSFPSGHTFCAFTSAVSITLYKKKLGFILIPFAILIGFSRIFIGAHYFSDVLTGAILGTLLGVLHYFSVKTINKKRKEFKFLCD